MAFCGSKARKPTGNYLGPLGLDDWRRSETYIDHAVRSSLIGFLVRIGSGGGSYFEDSKKLFIDPINQPSSPCVTRAPLIQ